MSSSGMFDPAMAGSPRLAARLAAAPPPLIFLVGAIAQYAGAALAVRLFPVLSAAAVAWLRVLVAAVVLCAWRQPWRSGRSGRRLPVVGLGVSLAVMNLSFYLAIDRLPLGTAVAIEFLGPITVAAVGTRSRRDLAALLLAMVGVVTLSEVHSGGSRSGLVLALIAAAGWAGYIVFAHRVAGHGDGIGSLSAAMAVAAVVLAPVAAPAALPAFIAPATLAACVAVALLSTVIPYVLDQVVMRRLGRGAYALLLSLLPATAAVTGFVALRQVPTPLEALGIGLVVAAVALRSPA